MLRMYRFTNCGARLALLCYVSFPFVHVGSCACTLRRGCIVTNVCGKRAPHHHARPLASRRTTVVLGFTVSTQSSYIQCRVGKSCICDVLAWCPWWTVSRSTRIVSVEVMQRHCVCTVVQTHRVRHMFSDALCPVGSGNGMDCFMASPSESCDRVCFCFVVGLHSSPP